MNENEGNRKVWFDTKPKLFIVTSINWETFPHDTYGVIMPQGLR